MHPTKLMNFYLVVYIDLLSMFCDMDWIILSGLHLNENSLLNSCNDYLICKFPIHIS